MNLLVMKRCIQKRPFLKQIKKVIDFTNIRLLSVAILVNQLFVVFYNSA